MGRLIDADKVLEKMRNKLDMQDMYLPIHFQELIIDEMETAYDIDKVVEQLENVSNNDTYFRTVRLSRAVQIVKEGGIE